MRTISKTIWNLTYVFLYRRIRIRFPGKLQIRRFQVKSAINMPTSNFISNLNNEILDKKNRTNSIKLLRTNHTTHLICEFHEPERTGVSWTETYRSSRNWNIDEFHEPKRTGVSWAGTYMRSMSRNVEEFCEPKRTGVSWKETCRSFMNWNVHEFHELKRTGKSRTETYKSFISWNVHESHELKRTGVSRVKT